MSMATGDASSNIKEMSAALIIQPYAHSALITLSQPRYANGASRYSAQLQGHGPRPRCSSPLFSRICIMTDASRPSAPLCLNPIPRFLSSGLTTFSRWWLSRPSLDRNIDQEHIQAYKQRAASRVGGPVVCAGRWAAPRGYDAQRRAARGTPQICTAATPAGREPAGVPAPSRADVVRGGRGAGRRQRAPARRLKLQEGRSGVQHQQHGPER
jgi:hypothetical protein